MEQPTASNQNHAESSPGNVSAAMTYPLKKTFTTPAGVTLSTLSLRRLNVKDLKDAKKISANPADWDDTLIAAMTGLVSEDLELMDLEDYMNLQKRLYEFTGMAK